MTIKVKGLKELIRANQKMPELVGRNMRIGLKKATRLVREYAKDHHNFRHRSHRLEKAINSRVEGNSRGEVYLDENIADYSIFVHEGTKPHKIRASARPLRFPVAGGFAFAKSVNHPGTKPDQFIYNAAEKNQSKTNEIFQSVIDKSIKEAGL